MTDRDANVAVRRRVALVTGANRGLGLETSRQLLATLLDDGPTGGFFHNRRPIDW